MAEEARGRPESWRQEPPWITDTTVLETVEASDPIAFGTALIGEPAAESAYVDLRGGRSQLGTTCPFFRRETADGTLGRPIEMPESINRCAAYGEPRPQSLRQQQLVCLSSRHVDCPRYLHAAGPAPLAPRARAVPRAILAAIVILLLSAAASFAFVLARGGLALPQASGGSGGVAGAVGTPVPTAAVVATPEPSASPSEAPTPTPTASPLPTPTATAQPTGPVDQNDRYALLQPCPDKPDCYVYRVRRGDTLTGIAKFFGTTLDTLRELNPWTKTKGLQTGKQLLIPPPPR